MSETLGVQAKISEYDTQSTSLSLATTPLMRAVRRAALHTRPPSALCSHADIMRRFGAGARNCEFIF